MAFDWNIFRILADLSHTLSKCILLWAIHNNKSAEGVSLMTQQFYLVVFLCRYLPFPLWRVDAIDYSDASAFHNLWNLTLKIFYISSSAYTIFIMMRVFARTREREKAWKLGIASFVGSLVLAPFVMLIFDKKVLWSFREFSWVFSIILESVCVLPQLLLLRQTTVPTVIDSFYLLTLGSYRAFYVVNWIVRGALRQPNSPISIIFGVIQTLLYADFAWVYFTRQRVKLRGGSIVDSDDLGQGWIVKRLLGRHSTDEEDVESHEPASGRSDGAADPRPHKVGRTWGPRGISVSADDPQDVSGRDGLADPTNFEDEDSDDDANGPAAAAKPGDNLASPSAVGNGSEWHEDSRK